MKTKNNVQNSLLRWAAVLVSFVLISFTVSAQDFWKRLIENSSFGNIALAMVENKEFSAENNYSAFLVETETEKDLLLEKWMVSETTFSVPSNGLRVETEAALVPQDWMFNEHLFTPEIKSEPALQLESWMTSESIWKL